MRTNYCTKRGCNRPAFMDEDRCFDHAGTPGGFGFKLWIAFCAVLGAALTAVGIWAVVTLVMWVTAR